MLLIGIKGCVHIGGDNISRCTDRLCYKRIRSHDVRESETHELNDCADIDSGFKGMDF